MPKTEEQFEEIRRDRRELIMNTALKLFADNGYFHVSISQIADEAKISKGLLYNYFDSKEDLLKATLYKGVEDITENFDPNHDGVLEHDELIGYINTVCEILKSNLDFWRLFFYVVRQPRIMELIEPRIQELGKTMIHMLYNYFEKRGYKDPGVETHFFTSIMKGVGIMFLNDPENYPIKEVKEKLLKMYDK
ncbi:MAG: TetR/AcrR family transcriptional regulator [Saprospiraceae bacterium]|nr:TetR/AcrR family transcriptional regulator [Saprospiraceae bacterium]